MTATSALTARSSAMTSSENALRQDISAKISQVAGESGSPAG